MAGSPLLYRYAYGVPCRCAANDLAHVHLLGRTPSIQPAADRGDTREKEIGASARFYEVRYAGVALAYLLCAEQGARNHFSFPISCRHLVSGMTIAY